MKSANFIAKVCSCYQDRKDVDKDVWERFGWFFECAPECSKAMTCPSGWPPSLMADHAKESCAAAIGAFYGIFRVVAALQVSDSLNVKGW